ncbi:MAG: CD225/dispanin family protein [Gordonia sp. (in: high G+C Gram-positive bacteria)]|uniref:CD225/dispanin family protein n=1 Tax=Gordonia sp. (in: high G+C Gram-positive bacteria) TaxID=84139 RepID=UPI0039E48CEB
MTNPDPTNAGQPDPAAQQAQPDQPDQPVYPAQPGYPAQPAYPAPAGYPGQPGVDAAAYGAQYGYPGQAYGQPYGPPPDNNIVLPIISTVLGVLTVFWCIGIAPLVLGIIGIVKSNSVNTLWSTGDQAGAGVAAEDAKKFGLWGLISFGALVALGVILIIIAVIASPS